MVLLLRVLLFKVRSEVVTIVFALLESEKVESEMLIGIVEYMLVPVPALLDSNVQSVKLQ